MFGYGLLFETKVSIFSEKECLRRDKFTRNASEGERVDAISSVTERVYAGYGRPDMKDDGQEGVLVDDMAPGRKHCLPYLPIRDGLHSLEIGVESDAAIEVAADLFRHRVVVLGSSRGGFPASGR